MIKIGKHTIGRNYPIYVIAEIGINHNGDMQLVKNLIDEAHSAGADAVKFQKRTPEICVPEKQKSIKEILLGEGLLIWNISKKLNYPKKIISISMIIVKEKK